MTMTTNRDVVFGSSPSAADVYLGVADVVLAVVFGLWAVGCTLRWRDQGYYGRALLAATMWSLFLYFADLARLRFAVDLFGGAIPTSSTAWPRLLIVTVLVALASSSALLWAKARLVPAPPAAE